MASITLSDGLVQSYIFYSAVLALKMLLVGSLTGMQRMKKGVVANPEDVSGNKKVKFDDPDVERVRRAHLNDLENIPVFWILGALYLTTGPAAFVATLLFRLFTAFRILYTYAYAISPWQSARGMSYMVSFLVNVFMAVKIVLHYFSAM